MLEAYGEENDDQTFSIKIDKSLAEILGLKDQKRIETAVNEKGHLIIIPEVNEQRVEEVRAMTKKLTDRYADDLEKMDD